MPGKPISAETRSALIARYRLLSPELSGAPLKAACREAARDAGCHWRTVYRWREQMSREGHVRNAHRSTAGRTRSLAPDAVGELERLSIAPGTRHISDAELTRQLLAAFPEQSVTYSAVHRARSRFLASIQDITPPSLRIEAPHPNYQWQIDATLSDLFIQPARPGELPRRVPLEVVIDEHSRCCMYAMYCARDDSGVLSSLMFNAILPQSDEWPMCGVPRKLRADWGKVYVSDHADRFIDAMGIERSQCQPYHPEGKGKVERFIGTIHHMLEPTLPGYCGSNNQGDDSIDPARDFAVVGGASAPTSPRYIDSRSGEPLLSLAELNAILHSWVVSEYHWRDHGTLGRTPAATWASAITSDLSAVPQREFLAESLLVPVPGGGTRVVRHASVQLDGVTFHHEMLAGFEGGPIGVRYSYEDMRQVWCFNAQGACICEAQAVGTVLLADDINWRHYRTLRRDHLRQAKARREVIEQTLAQPAAVAALHDRIHAQAEATPRLLVPTPGEWQPPTDPGADELAGLEIAGIPVAAAGGRI